ncbi:MAG TPA: peptidase S1, partial [Brevundimonas sp.]|nr:peptidase S1 [Brevundimonas sp.]
MLTTLAGFCLMASAASAQDPSAAPTFGQVSLSAGFTNDPYTVE